MWELVGGLALWLVGVGGAAYMITKSGIYKREEKRRKEKGERDDTDN